jgi:hypothetical protein
MNGYSSDSMLQVKSTCGGIILQVQNTCSGIKLIERPSK